MNKKVQKMKRRRNRVYDAEFKANAVRLVESRTVLTDSWKLPPQA